MLDRLLSLGSLLGPAIWLSNSEVARVHRNVCLKCHPSLGRLQARAVFICKISLWYFFLVWVHLVRALLLSRKITREEHSKSENNTFLLSLIPLIYLGFWLGVRPQAYFSLKLHQKPRHLWLSYVFPQEQPSWHQIHGYNLEQQIRTVLADKNQTEARLTGAQINCVQTLKMFKRNSHLDGNHIFTRQNYFIKPNKLNAMRGCVRLEYKHQSAIYTLTGYDLSRQKVSIQGQKDIATFLELLLNNTDLLIQPLLLDHPSMQPFKPPHANYPQLNDITTVRVITCYYNYSVSLVNALLEVDQGASKGWVSYGIDIKTGKVNNSPPFNNAEDNRLLNKTIPFWQEIERISCSAHQCLGQIKTVSWDICISTNGPIIIEGNSGWGVIAPQLVCSQPLLTGVLKSAYAQHSSKQT